jgi:hypothetical protein
MIIFRAENNDNLSLWSSMLNGLLTLHLNVPSIENSNYVERTFVHEVSKSDEENMRLLLKKKG